MSQNTGFRHFRNVLLVGSALSIHNKGGITLAFSSPKHIEDLTADDKVKISFAVCSRDDNFEHKVGRKQATERLEVSNLEIPGNDLQDLLHTVSIGNLRQGIKTGQLLPGLDEAQGRRLSNLIASARVR